MAIERLPQYKAFFVYYKGRYHSLTEQSRGLRVGKLLFPIPYQPAGKECLHSWNPLVRNYIEKAFIEEGRSLEEDLAYFNKI